MNKILERTDYCGTINRFDSSIRYDQTRNGVEAIIKKVRAEDGIKKGNLESCGVTAFCCCQEAIGSITSKDYFHFPSGVPASFDDAVMIHINTYHIYESDPDRFDNRWARSYPKLAATILKNVNSQYLKIDSIQDVFDALGKGCAVQLCLEDPGHYIAVIGYLSKTRELVYMDSWGGRPGLKNKGSFELMNKTEFDSNVKDFMITYEKVG